MAFFKSHGLKLLLVVAVIAHVSLWLYARDMRSEWANVPPVPSRAGALMFAMGDSQFAYRSIGFMLQNLGDSGRSMPLNVYNYDELAKWMFLEDQLDPESAYVPSLAAYYFSAVNTPQKLYPVLDYLSVVGGRPEGQKWRWLAQAVYIARFAMNDLNRALELANQLADMGAKNPKMPPWTRQMPAFIHEAKGDKKDAVSIMIEILKSEAETLPPQEVNYMRDYICNRILDEQEAAVHPLCQDPIP